MRAPPWPRLLAVVLAAASLRQARAKCYEDYEGTKHLQGLRKSLLCGYDVDAGPTAPQASQTVTVVTVRLLRTRLDVDEASNVMTLFGYVMLTWRDAALAWDASQHGNATRIYVDADEIWTPKIALLDAPSRQFKGGQALVMNGTVLWTLLLPLRAPCRNDPTRWPYDRMECNASLVNLSPANSRLEKTTLLATLIKWRNRGWMLTRMEARSFRGASGSPMGEGLLLRVVAERNADMQEAAVAVPCLAVAALLLASLWLPADAPHRALLLGAVILIQVLLSVSVAMRVRVVGAHAPGLLLLQRDALFLSGAAVLQWVAARWLLDAAPRWPIGYLGLLADYAASPGGALVATMLVLPATSTPASAEAVDVAVAVRSKRAAMAAITDRASFVVLAVTFAVLALRLAP